MSNQKVGLGSERSAKKTERRATIGKKNRSAFELSLLSTLYDELFGDLDDLVDRIDDASDKIPSKQDVEYIRQVHSSINKKLLYIQVFIGLQFVIFVFYLGFSLL